MIQEGLIKPEQKFPKQKLKELLMSISRLQLDIADITDTAKLIEDLGFDSITLITLVVKLEESYQIIVEDEDLLMDFMETVSSLYQYILKKMETKR